MCSLILGRSARADALRAAQASLPHRSSSAGCIRPHLRREWRPACVRRVPWPKRRSQPRGPNRSSALRSHSKGKRGRPHSLYFPDCCRPRPFELGWRATSVRLSKLSKTGVGEASYSVQRELGSAKLRGMSEQFEGSCLCGAVRFVATGQPESVAWCHSESCRKHSGAPVSVFVAFKRGAYVVTEGQITKFNSSPGRWRGFCAKCGLTLTCESERPQSGTRG